MKKIFTTAIMALAILMGASTISASAQNFKVEGKTFVENKATAGAMGKSDYATSYEWKDSKGQTYPIFLHRYTKGEKEGQWTAYVVKVSAKSGKEYKCYLKDGQSIAEQIRKEMGI